MKKTIYLGLNCISAKPTKKFKPAIWECMLGTIYAQNEKGVTKYFDYDYKAARRFCGAEDWRGVQIPETMLRLSKYNTIRVYCSDEKTPRNGQKVLWIER